MIPHRSRYALIAVLASAAGCLPASPGGSDAAIADAGGPGLPGADGGPPGTSDAGAVIDGSAPFPLDASTYDAGALPADGGAVGDAGAPSGDASAPVDAAVPGDAGAPAPADPGFAACVSALKPRCTKATLGAACSSMLTATIPLSNGGTIGNVVVEGGPYGSIADANQGKAFANSTSFLEAACSVLAGGFGEPQSVTDDVLDLRGNDLSLYTVFRPACMHDGEKYPVITWGNGTCGQTAGYGTLLATVASHGFVVVASNSRYTDGGRNEMLRALDFAAAMNKDSKSPLYGRLDLSKVGAMGHSQGAGATANAAKDARIKSIILWNGVSSGAVAKPYLQVTGDRDISDPTVASVSSAVAKETQPAAWLFYHQVPVTGGNATGHLTLMMQPERVVDVAVAWWKYRLLGDAQARKTFVGPDCTLCSERTAYAYGQARLD